MANTSRTSELELLSPVGSFDALIAAVNNGANSVYLGSKLFNARRLAENFRPDELKRAVQYATLNNVRVYLTLNTLIKNNEITALLNQVSVADQCGVSALIMQDLTFAPLIKKYFPNMEIHASTQANIMNSSSIEYWKKYVDVFVLARELTKQEVRTIYDNTKVQLEVFVHGHLCVSYSGQCLISSLIGSRSGNRGMCASSCRKQYNGDEYLLSAKDLCMIENVQDIIESGATTLKIEGRMKSAEYVATTTREYRKKIDAGVKTGNSNSKVSKQTMDDLRMAFNRNFTKGYFNDEKAIVDPLLSSKRGIFLGTVKDDLVTIEEDVELFDGITVLYRGEREGNFVKVIEDQNGKKIKQAYKGESVRLPVYGFKNGANVFLTSKHGGKNLLGKENLIPINILIDIKEGEKPIFKFTASNKTSNLTMDFVASKPKKHPLTKEDIESKIYQIESKIFTINKLDIITDNSFIPKSEITNICKNLDKIILDLLVPLNKDKIKIEAPVFKESKSEKKTLHVQVYRLDDVENALDAGCDVLYYDVLSKDLMQVKELCKGRAEFFVHTPMALTDKDCKKVIEIIKTVNPDGVLVNNVGLLNHNLKQKITLGYQMNIFNDNQLQHHGGSCIASIELNAREINDFKNKKDLIYYAHGTPVVMTFKEKFNANSLIDKKRYRFRLRKTLNDQTEMLYSNSIGILQHTNKILGTGVTQLYLDLENDVTRLVQTYKKLLNGESVSTIHLKRNVTIGNLEKGVM